MKKFLVLSVCAAFFCVLQGAPVKENGIKWLPDVKSAQKILGKEKKSILLFFTAPGWCGPCRALEKGPIASPEFAAIAKKNAAVKMDYSNRNAVSENARAALQKYKIEGFPSLLVLDVNGREKGRIVGNLPAGSFFAELKKLIEK